MSYYGGHYKMSKLRTFSFHPNDEDDGSDSLTAPLFHEQLPSNDIHMKSYGGTDILSMEANGNHCRTLGRRLDQRRVLLESRRVVINVVCLLALIGVIFMMVETELFISNFAEESDAILNVLKACISVSTIFLLLGICANYYVDLRIKALDTGVREWQSVISNWTIVCFLMELVVCSVHPFPGDVKITFTSHVSDSREVSIDAVLSIVMMMRVYLVAKFAVVHSRLVTDTSTTSIGALSKIKINSMFVFKAAMTKSPGKLLISIMLTTFLVNSWAMRACENYYLSYDHRNSYMEAMWLIATTFLTVGYGDRTPQSYCGRYISICTGVMGVGTTALMVAVLARKLEQTRSERYVFNMVTRIHIEKRRKTAAANVIKSLIHLWQIRKYSVSDKNLRRRYADSLKTAMRQLRIANADKAHIDDFNVGIIEVSETVNRIGKTVDKLETMQTQSDTQKLEFNNRLDGIEHKLEEIKALLVSRS